MPTDLPPTLTDFRKAWDDGVLAYHEDFLDRLNADHTWGSDNPGETGGSGIVFGYSTSDADAVWAWMHAMDNTTAKPDDEHRIRLLRPYMAGAAMFRDPYPLRRIVALANEAKTRWWLDGQYNCNVPYFLEQVQLGKPMPGNMGRAFGWICWGEAMALKVQPGRSRAFGETCLHLCETAANLWTGQIVQDSDSSITETDVTYTQHWIISMIGATALAYRLGWDVPTWVLTGARCIHEQPAIDYHGQPHPPKFVRTEGQQLVPAGTATVTSFYEELCAVLYKMTHDHVWLERSCKFGFAASSVDGKAEKLAALTDAQGLRGTVMLRGILT